MRYRITEPGYEKLTGLFGSVEFVDGVSVEDLSPVEARRLAAAVRIETADEAAQDPSAATELQNSHHHQVGLEIEAKRAAEVHGTQKAAKPAKAHEIYTREALEKLADEKGIAALRDVAEAYDVRGRSIPDLIEKIMAAQATAAKPATDEPAPAATEAPAAE